MLAVLSLSKSLGAGASSSSKSAQQVEGENGPSQAVPWTSYKHTHKAHAIKIMVLSFLHTVNNSCQLWKELVSYESPGWLTLRIDQPPLCIWNLPAPAHPLLTRCQRTLWFEAWDPRVSVLIIFQIHDALASSRERSEIRLWSCAIFWGLMVTVNNRILSSDSPRVWETKVRDGSSLESWWVNLLLDSY